MKRVLLLFITAIYAVTSTGVSIDLHLCQDKLMAIAVQQKLQDFYCCNKPVKDTNCCPNDCCRDISKVVKLDQVGLKQIQDKAFSITALTYPVLLFAVLTADTAVGAVNRPVPHPPPLLSAVRRHLAIGVLLV